MASVSVVGQHRLDSELQLFLFKLPGVRKRGSREKMLARGSGSGGDCGSATTERQSGNPVPVQHMSAGPVGETVVSRGMMFSEGCGARAVSAAPRRPDRDREEGSADTRGSHTGHGDCNCNANCDSNHNTSSRRRSSFKRSSFNAMPSEAVANGHKGPHRHRDAPHGRRGSQNRDRDCDSVPSALSAQGDSGGLPLERLTQGKTGVVKLARTEPSRREAWSIFPQGVDERVNPERGEGHRFEAKKVMQDWCDVCTSQVNAQALKCQSKYSVPTSGEL